MNLLPIVQLLEDAGLGRRGETLFINEMPAKVVKGILVKNKLSGTMINWEIPGYYKTGFQIIVRATGYEEGSALATELSVALTMNNVQIDDMNVRYLHPRHLPVCFPVTPGGQRERPINFDIALSVPG